MAGDYFDQLDKYLGPTEENKFLSGTTVGSSGNNGLSEPIVPISKLGATFGENNARGQQDVLGSMLSSIRQGSSTLQLALQTDPAQGGVGSITKSRREEIKDLIKVSGVNWEGLELNPGNTSNLSGYDPRNRTFNEQQRRQDIQHVKDAILFAGDIQAGGGVDIWSQEFHREMGEASKRFDKQQTFVDFEGYDENKHAVKTLVDKRTGQITQFSTAQTPSVAVPLWETASNSGVGPNGIPFEAGDYLDEQGNKLEANANDPEFLMSRVPKWNEEKNEFEAKTMNWSDFKQYAQERNQKEFSDESEYLTPEQWFRRVQMETSYAQQKGQSYYYSRQYSDEKEQLKRLSEAYEDVRKQEEGLSEEELERKGLLVPSRMAGMPGGPKSSDYIKKSEQIKKQINDMKYHLKHIHEASSMADAQAAQVFEEMNSVVGVDEYAKERTFNSYAELGMFALKETERKKPMQPIYVGPELGFPEAYGGHPGEFVEMIEQSRERMFEQLKKDPAYRGKYDDDGLRKLTEKHIGGVLDTAHLTMWYNHFPKESENESEENRLQRFNDWYKDQMKRLADSGTVKNIQIVDSMTGNHRHLPVGEGIFPTVEGVKIMQENGFDGMVVSEGHMEDSLEPGRIQYSLWKSFGASLGTGPTYFTSGGGNSFGNVYVGAGGAAGYRAPPNYIVGAYNPSNDWKLWTEVPLE